MSIAKFGSMAVALCLFMAGRESSAAPPARRSGASDVVLEDVVRGLGAITDFAFLPDGAVVVTEKDGGIKVSPPGRAAAIDVGRFQVDDRSEKGLLGVAVDPAFADTRRLFFYYSAKDDAGGTDRDRHRIVSVTMDADHHIDIAAAKVLLRNLRGPANHDGGGLAIGPDGKLYVGVGDTGCNSGRRPHPPYPPSNYFGTCLSNANGKVLRIELDGSIPADNPLADPKLENVSACGDRCRDPIQATPLAPPRREIWAWGFRNPWRIWPDPKTGRLWVGDVGEVAYEEVNVVEKGKHYGWPFREGYAGWPAARCREVVPDTGVCVEPAYACAHGPGTEGIDGDCQSITGGVIVDGCPWPVEQRSRYIFGDNANGLIWSVKVNAARTGIERRSRRELARLRAGLPVSIRLGDDGLAYVAVFPGDDGRIVRIAPARPAEECSRANDSKRTPQGEGGQGEPSAR